MKVVLTGLFFFIALSCGVNAQTKRQDSLAIQILDRMSDVVGELQSCRFQLNTATDVSDITFGSIKEFSDYEVYMSGPNKMLIDAHGKKGHRQYLFNGHQVAYYSFNENNFGILPAPETIIQTVDSLHEQYGIEFPAVDFFYPTFTDDLLQETDVLSYLGIIYLSGKEYFHIAASSEEKNYEFWIKNDTYCLPKKFVITYKNQKGNPQYQATFTDWQINPVLPEAIFDFTPPPGATQVRILSKHEK